MLKFAKSSGPALMTHVVIGYPSLKESIQLVRVMADAGVSTIELQIPFTDPIADGPTIMHANSVALANGVKTRDCLKAMEQLSGKVNCPLFFMSYYNLLFSYAGGMSGFLRNAKSSGALGLIVPDIPFEERSDGFWTMARENHLLTIPIVSPVTPPDRLRAISKVADSGFVYCVSTTGTTGARSELPNDLPAYLKRVRQSFKIPRAVGFGISNAAQIRALRGHAEIAVIGSAVIDLLERAEPKARRKALQKYLEKLST